MYFAKLWPLQCISPECREGTAIYQESGRDNAPPAIYVADYGNDRIQKFTPDGTFVTKWGVSGSGDGEFDSPYGIAVDMSGNVFVSEYYPNDRIQVFAPKY